MENAMIDQDYNDDQSGNDATNSADLDMVIRYYDDYINQTIESRAEAERDRDYYDNKQWTQDEVDIVESRGQPVITSNRIKPKVDYLIGLEQQTRTDPKAYPRTPVHEKDAESITDAIRFVCDNNDFQDQASNGFKNLNIEGIEAAEVLVKKRGGKLQVEIVTAEWDRIFYDVHSRKPDFSDAKYKGVSVWLDVEDAIDRWPDKEDIIMASFESNSHDETFMDTPRTQWTAVDDGRQRVRFNYIYFLKNGVWHYAFYTESGFLDGPAESPYLNDMDEPDCALIFQSVFVDRDGNRYGSVRQVISQQDELNKRRSKFLHLGNSRQTYSTEGAVADENEAKRQLALPDGHVKMQRGEFGKHFGVIPTGDLEQAHFSLMQDAKNEIDMIGSNASLQGKDGGSTSGRQDQIKQQAGQVELGPIFNAHTNWKREIYRHVWYRVRQFWTEERWIRVTDDEKNLKWVALNRKVTARDVLQQKYQNNPELLQQMMTQYANDPRMNQVVKVENELAQIDVDIILEEIPDVANIEQEQFDTLAKLYDKSGGEVPFSELVKLSSLRNKDKFIEAIEGTEEAKRAKQQQQQEMEQLQAAGAKASVDKVLSEVDKNTAQADKAHAEALKTMVEVHRPPPQLQHQPQR